MLRGPRCESRNKAVRADCHGARALVYNSTPAGDTDAVKGTCLSAEGLSQVVSLVSVFLNKVLQVISGT